jgi:hypothetical protein
MSAPHEAASAAAIKVANLATYGGSGAAVVFGLTPSEWQVIGIIGGLLTAVGGFLLSWWYKHQHLKIAKGDE